MYAIYYQTKLSKENILGIDKGMLDKVIDAYNNGITKFALKGKNYSFSNLSDIKIFEIKNNEAYLYLINTPKIQDNYLGFKYISPELLGKVGTDITYELFGNNDFGYIKQEKKAISNDNTALSQYEIEKNEEILIKLIDKKAFLEKELVLTYDSEKKFTLQEQIKELEIQINGLRK